MSSLVRLEVGALGVNLFAVWEGALVDSALLVPAAWVLQTQAGAGQGLQEVRRGEGGGEGGGVYRNPLSP